MKNTLNHSCYHCGKSFGGMVFRLHRAHERVHFFSRGPEVLSNDLTGLGTYRSCECFHAGAGAVMAHAGIPLPASAPHVGPIELCAICRAPVDMTRFHLAYAISLCHESATAGAQMLRFDSLAVVCTACRPVTGAAAGWRERPLHTHPLQGRPAQPKR